MKNKLLIHDFTLSDLSNCLKRRGPDTYNILIQSNDLLISYIEKYLLDKNVFETLSQKES